MARKPNPAAFKPGQSGNPAGKPKGASSYKTLIQGCFIDIMQSKVEAETTDENGKKVKVKIPYYQAFLEQIKQSAMKPDSKTGQFLADKLLNGDVLDQLDKQFTRARAEDSDFQTYRIVKKCHDIQQKILLTKEKYILLMAGRRAGKSEADKFLAVQKVISVNNSRVLFIGLSFTRCIEVFWNSILDELETLGVEVSEKRRTDGIIVLQNGSEIHFCGNTTVDERNKLRGSKWHLIVIDEAQSQKALPILLEEILEPTLLDYNGQICLSGTGPRIAGTYWELIWSGENSKEFKRSKANKNETWNGLTANAARFNWNISDNPFIPNYKDVLEKIKEEKGLTDSSPLFIREYLGKICYDTDALVYRLKEDNFYTDEELASWINKQNRADLRFTAGLDYGFEDADGFAIVLFSTTADERFVVYDYTHNRTGITELANKIKEGIEYVNTNPLFQSIPEKFFYIYSDGGGGGKKISFELNQQFGLPTMDAYKANKDMAIEMLQEEVRRGIFKTRVGSIFEDEARKTVFGRNDRDELTRVIDDDTFHPNLLDAVLYSMRYIWTNYTKSQ